MKYLFPIIGIVFLAMVVRAQETPPAIMPPTQVGGSPLDALTNVTTVPLANETIGFTAGTVMSGAGTSFKNIEIIDWSITKNFFVGAELINGGANSVLESAGLRGGVYKNLSNARIYGYIGGRRNWETAKWEGFSGLGLAYTPFQSQTNSILQKFSGVTEERLIVTDLRNAPPQETVVGVRYSF